jgi:hypothetical protein
VADVAEREVSTCRLDERVGDVRDRHRRDGSDPVVVVDHDRVVLGLVDAEALDVRIGETPQYFKKHGVRHTLVTTSDGVLVGLLRMEQTGSASRP